MIVKGPFIINGPISINVNDGLLITLTDDEFRQGGIALFVTDKQWVAFDNLRIESQGSGKLVVPGAASTSSYKSTFDRGRPGPVPRSPE